MEKLIKLSYINELDNKIAANNGFIQVLIGPRQVGKTTSILDLMEKKYHPSFLYFSADRYLTPVLCGCERFGIRQLLKKNFDRG